ncbi:hypothetical protein GQ44DRAFT_661160 [Phaeosphaeriaceae sp. PMI808]|nr:hypothetical protein GQ44DRAFT_661160 [Phaeosphaeriaceae sp. PMI808]
MVFVRGGIVVIAPMVKIYLEGVHATWGKTLEGQKPADIRLMAERVWDNTLRPVARILNRSTTPREFCRNVTGAWLRWEVVGILVSLVSLVAQSLKDGDPIFCSHDEAPVDRAGLALKMHNASEMCVQFCDEFGVLNDLYLWLLYENAIVYCSMRSKGSYENAKKNASLTTALLSCNLHQEIAVDDNTPFFIAELRKRLFICAYDNDKYTAAYSGRPPQLTRHYCQLQIPLDLTDDQTMSEGTELEDAVGHLDDEGWNQQGTVQRSTFARLSATNALIIEDILEISLGNLPQATIIQRANDIENRTNNHWDNLPDFLRLDITDPWTTQHSPLELLFLAFIRLNHLDHHFMLQRTLDKKIPPTTTTTTTTPPPRNTRLLSTCTDIFTLVTHIVNAKDHFKDFQIDFVQILSKHGIPTASILALELLHQEQHPHSDSARAYPLHRSEIVQQLSVFVACLGTVRGDASGFQSCDRGRRFLKRVLDLVLGCGAAQGRGEDGDLFGQGGVESEVDFGMWLQGMEWDQESLFSFG